MTDRTIKPAPADPVREYVEAAIMSFLLDPPANAYQCGYLAALLTVHREGLQCGPTPATNQAEQMLQGLRDGPITVGRYVQ